MPGFMVHGVGGTANDDHKQRSPASTQEYYHSYSWEIQSMFQSPSSNAVQPLMIHAKDITMPAFTVGIETNQGASLEYKFAKSVAYGDVKVTFYDVVGMLAVLETWRRTVWTPEAGLKTAAEYKRESTVASYTPDYAVEKSVRWKLIGSWPSVIRHGDLTYTNSEVKLVEVTVTYDWAEHISTSAGGF